MPRRSHLQPQDPPQVYDAPCRTGTERNIEAGVLLDHPRLAGALAGQFGALKNTGRLKQMGHRGHEG